MKIQLSGIAAKLLNTNEYEYNGACTKKDLLTELCSKNPDLKKYHLEVSVNSTAYPEEDMEFKDKDQVMVFGAFAGG